MEILWLCCVLWEMVPMGVLNIKMVVVISDSENVSRSVLQVGIHKI
jgi:hypothetical protein